MQETPEQVVKLRKERGVQLSNWRAKKSHKQIQRKVFEDRADLKEEERTKTKHDVKNKVTTRHSDINGLLLNGSGKQKNSFKRKMST